MFNRLIAATPAGAAAATLAYDPAARLHEIASAGAATRFLYDGAQMIAEYNSSNVLQRRFVHGPGVDEPLVWYEGAGTADRRYLITDQLGSIVAANGDTTDIYSYDEYGQPNSWTGARLRYTGQMMLPEAQLYHYKARAYLPQLGRFAQTDPVLFGGGMNLYAYVGNDPVNFVDPSGRQEEQDCVRVTGSHLCGGSPSDTIYYTGNPPTAAMTAAQRREALIAIINDESAPLGLRQTAFDLLTDGYSAVLWDQFARTYVEWAVLGGASGAGVSIAIRSAPAFLAGSRLLGPGGEIFGRTRLGGSGVVNNNDFLRLGWGYRQLGGEAGEHVFRLSGGWLRWLGVKSGHIDFFVVPPGTPGFP